jgi:membrane protease YdiL (CAAX protease family)
VRSRQSARPVLPVAAAVLLVPAAAVVSRLVSRLVGADTVPRPYLAEGLLLAGTLTIVALTGWWRETGLAVRGRQWPWVLLLLGLLLPQWLLTTPALVSQGRWALLPQSLVLVALVGFNEETLVRGVILSGLSWMGPLVAGLLSALIFGLLHLTNLLSLDPGFVVLQVVTAPLLGLLFAALRFRMVTLWPLIATHGLLDLPALLLGFPAHLPPVNAVRVIVSIVLVLPFGLTGLGLLIADQLEASHGRR